MMRVIQAHLSWMLKELIRQPAYVVSTLAFPAIFYLIFAVPESKTEDASNYMMASFSAFAVFGVLFLQFGVSQAQERSHSWYQFIKSLPVRWYELMVARFLTAQFFAVLSALTIVVLALILTEAKLSPHQWLAFAALLFLPGLSFCVMGLALGFWTNEKTSLPIGNLIYLPLSFLGGLWKPPEILPESLKKLSELMPTRMYGDMLWSIVKKQSFPTHSLWGLCLWTFVFSIFLFWGIKRELWKTRR